MPISNTVGKLREFDDLDDLLGSMSEQDVECIEQSVTKQRKIDHEMWK